MMQATPKRKAAVGSAVAWRGKPLLLSAVAVSALLLAAPALAQTKPPTGETIRLAPQERPTGETIRLAPQERPFNPALLKYLDRPAIPFKPFDRVVIEPRSATAPMPITATSVITLPNGKMAPAGTFYDQLDQSERYLNQHGYSLRTMSTTMPTTVATIPVDAAMFKEELAKAPAITTLRPLPNFEVVHSYATLSTPTPIVMSREDYSALGLSPKLLTTDVLARAGAVSASGARGLHVGPVIIGPVHNSLLIPHLMLDCQSFTKTKTWDWHTGSTSTFAAYATGSIGYDGLACSPPPPNEVDKQSHFTIAVEADAGGSVFGNTQNLLKVTGSLAGSRVTDQINANLGVIVLGQTIASVNQAYNGHWGVDNTVSRSVDFSTSTYIPVGPFSVHAVLGAQGQAGFHYQLDLYPTSVAFAGTPTVNVNAYAQAGLNVIVAEAGVSANLALINWTGHVNANAAMGVIFVPVLYGNVYADSNLNMLSGNVDLYVKYWTTCGWFCLEQVQTNYNLFNWSGYQYNSVLFNEQYAVAL